MQTETNIDINRFSEREKDVIKLLLQGKGNKQIALELDISTRTVEFHLGNIFNKLEVGSRTETIIKLSGKYLWKSTGHDSGGYLEESPVEKIGNTADNIDHPSLLRRIPMSYKTYIGIGLLTAVFVIILVNWSTKNSAGATSLAVTAIHTEVNMTPVIEQSTATLLPTLPIPATPTSPSTIPLLAASSGQDMAHFVDENYPDGTNIPAETTFTKTWKLQNKGTTTWTTDYAFVVTESSHPLGITLGEPYEIRLPNEVKPEEIVDISVNLTAPASDGIYEVHYILKNAYGQLVLGDGAEVWVKISIGNVQINSVIQANNVTMQLINVQKNDAITNVEICAQLPDTQDWNLNGVVLIAGNVRNLLSGYMLKSPKDASTYSNSYRCYIVEFPVGVVNYGTSPVSISISNIRVPAENNLEANCACAKQQLAPLYPVLDFTCGPAGFFYSNLILPVGMNQSEADKIIMDALEQAIYGPWELNE